MFLLRKHKTTQKPSDKQAISGRKLALPLTLEGGHVPGLLQNMSFAICALIGAAIVWGGVAKMRELAITQGEIVPTSAVKTVNHFEGGIVAEVLAAEGDLVEAGSPLLRLSAKTAKNDLEQLQIRAASLSLQKIRLSALLDGLPFETSKTPLAKSHPQMVKDQHELYNVQFSLHKRQKRTLQARIEQRRIELNALDLETKSLARQTVLKQDRVTSIEQLYKKKHATRSTLMEARSEHEKTLARSIALNGKRFAAREALIEARSLYSEWQAKSRKDLGLEFASTSTELAELQKALNKQNDRVERLFVRSPARGIVQHLAFGSTGEVVKPGDIVAKIVPVDEKVVAEVRLKPSDIGHVKIGDPAEIKISAFDPNVYGVLTGKVSRLSASTFQSDQGETYFKAIIALDKNSIGHGASLYKITPGMVVQVNIVTGAKSMIQYLLKPVYRSLDTAFSER